MKTDWEVTVVKLGAPQAHPNADKLEMFEVGGCPVLAQKGQYKSGDLAVYISIDSVVPTDRPEFAFLKSDGKATSRIKAKKLRGIFSMGLLVSPHSFDLDEEDVGKDVSERLGVTKYLSPIDRAELIRGPKGIKKRRDPIGIPIYGLDAYRKFKGVLRDGEQVVITEKIHGCNARYVYSDGKLHVGSHKSYRGSTRSRIGEFLNQVKLKFWTLIGKKHRAGLIESQGDVWWQMAEELELHRLLANFPDKVFYGEIYGEGIQDLTYDSPSGRRFLLFDIYDLKTKRYLDYPEMTSIAMALALNTPPCLYVGPWDPEKCTKFVDGPSPLADYLHLREGVVVRTLTERYEPKLGGRVSLKMVSEAYLTRVDQLRIDELQERKRA